MENVKALAVFAAIVLAATIAAIVVIPIRVAFLDLRDENAALAQQNQVMQAQLDDFKLCTLQTVECDFEKRVEFGD